MNEAGDVDRPVLVDSVDISVRRPDSSGRDAIHADTRAQILAQLTDRRVSSQSTATFGDEPRVEKDLPGTKLLTCECECLVNIVVDARVKPNPLHSAE